MDKLLEQYEKKFGECFPLMLTMGMSDEEIAEIAKDCIENNRPYDVSENGDY